MDDVVVCSPSTLMEDGSRRRRLVAMELRIHSRSKYDDSARPPPPPWSNAALLALYCCFLKTTFSLRLLLLRHQLGLSRYLLRIAFAVAIILRLRSRTVGGLLWAASQFSTGGQTASRPPRTSEAGVNVCRVTSNDEITAKYTEKNKL